MTLVIHMKEYVIMGPPMLNYYSLAVVKEIAISSCSAVNVDLNISMPKRNTAVNPVC